MDDTREQAGTAEQEAIARKFYWVGWFFLPLLWLLSWGYFRNVAEDKKTPAIRWYIRYGLIQCGCCMLVMLTWAVVYFFVRPHMGTFGSALAVITPKGYL